MTIFFVTGCSTYRLTPDLDTSLNPAGESIARKTQLVLPSESTNRISVVRRVAEKFSIDSTQKLSILSIKRKYFAGGEGFQCFEPLLFVITIGIIPTVCTQEYTFEIEWKHDDGQTQKKEIVVREKSISGWAALFVTLFPNWHFGSNGAINSILYTEVNSQTN